MQRANLWYMKKQYVFHGGIVLKCSNIRVNAFKCLRVFVAIRMIRYIMRRFFRILDPLQSNDGSIWPLCIQAWNDT